MEKRTNDSGELMIESSIIISITMVVLVAMIGLGFYLYQKAMVNTVASETAVYIAKNYKYTTLNKLDDEIFNTSQMKNLKKYRAYFSLSNKNKTKEYVNRRSKVTSFGNEMADIEKLEIKRDNIGRQRVELKISVNANIIFENVLVSIGLIDRNPKIYSTAYAECVDLTGYNSQVNFVNYLGNGIEKGRFGQIYNNVSTTIQNIKSIIDKLL